MTDLLIGWPLEPRKDSHRPFMRSRKSSHYEDLSIAEHYRSDGHLITIAPTGAGKGVGVIIPNLLHYHGPVITIDPKGENFAVTAQYRKNILRQRIFLLDPFEHVDKETLERVGVSRASLNPLDLVRAFGKGREAQLTMIATLLSGNSGSFGGSGEYGRFWDLEAEKLVAGVLGLTIERASAANRSPRFQEFINYIFADDIVYNLAVELDKKGLSTFAYKAIAAFLQKADRERSGVLSTAQSYLGPFISDALNVYLENSSVTPETIRNSDDYTLYIVIPPSKLISHSILLRLWISTLLSTIMERGESPLRRTLFLLDECAQLGTLDELRKAITLLRGYGLQVWMFFQDLSQLKRLYKDDHPTMVNNCGVFQSFGAFRASGLAPVAETVGIFEREEWPQLAKTQQIVSTANRGTRILRLLNYRQDGAFRGKFNENPLFSLRAKQTRPPVEPFPTNHLRLFL